MSIKKKLIISLKNMVSSDISCLIKYYQNSYLIEESACENDIELESLIAALNSETNHDIEKTINTNLNFNSSLIDTFSIKDNLFYVYSGVKTNNDFSRNYKNIHHELSGVIESSLLSSFAANPKNSNGKGYFHLIADASEELIFKLDKQGAFTDVNRYFSEILKFSKDEIMGKYFYDLIGEDYKADISQAFQKIISEKRHSSFEAELIPKIGIERLFSIKLIPIFSGQELKELIGIGSNLSELSSINNKNRQLEEKLKEAHRINEIERSRAKQQISILSELNNLKNEFISNISHELRTPLASIIGFSETILEDNSLTLEKSREFNRIVLTESKRLARLIDDILDFSELQSEKQKLQKSTLDIIVILKDIIKEYKDKCKEKNITLTSNIPESSIKIFADHDRMLKALSYIMSNAFKFTNKEGRITVMAQEFLKELEIVISDTGIGIDEQKLPSLFDKFSKIKSAGSNNLPGAGFGLVTVKQIIDLHKGLIRVKSEVDKGTSFIIRLPKYSLN